MTQELHVIHCWEWINRRDKSPCFLTLYDHVHLYKMQLYLKFTDSRQLLVDIQFYSS